MLIPKILGALADVCPGKGEIARYAQMAGVRLERTADGKPLAVVVDGRMLLVAEFEEAPPKNFDGTPPVPVNGFGGAVDAAVWRFLCDQADHDKPVCVQEQTDSEEPSRVVAQVGSGVVVTTNLEGRFPDWRKVLEPAERLQLIDAAANRDRYLRCKLDVRLWGKLCRVLEDVGLDTLDFDFPVPNGGATNPIRFTAKCSDDPRITVKGLLMPLNPGS